MTCRSDPLRPRYRECNACGQEFAYPSTGPHRPYCRDERCKERRHARAAWRSYFARLEREAEEGRRIPEGLPLFDEGLDIPLVGRASRLLLQGFSARFREAEQADLFYEMILLGDPCSYCGCRLTLKDGPDHIEPFVNGGSGSWENLTAACRPCNSSKADRPLLLWLLTSPRLSRLAASRRQLRLF